MAKFYTYSQNNSGGIFDQDENVDVTVVIEAENFVEANFTAQSIGIYFDGCEKGFDCDCCGDRWSDHWNDDDATDRPELFGTPIEEETNWIVHYLDGTIKRG